MSVNETIDNLGLCRDAVVNGEITTLRLDQYLNQDSDQDNYLVILFYPMDFTFVCPTEIIAFSERENEFQDLGAQIVGVSIDSVFVHNAWINTPRKDGGVGNINFPLVSDVDKKLCNSFNVLTPEGVSYRGMFIIDSSQKIKIAHVNDLPIGRNVDEVLRLVKALKFNAEHGEVCPVNWNPGSDTIKPNVSESKEYFNKKY